MYKYYYLMNQKIVWYTKLSIRIDYLYRIINWLFEIVGLIM